MSDADDTKPELGWAQCAGRGREVIRIYGCSDDLVEVEGDVREEFGCYNSGVSLVVGTEAAGVRVIARYAVANRGVWRLAVEPIDEGVPVPWPIHAELAERGYSMAIVIDCPPGTPVRKVAKVKAKAGGDAK